MADRDRVTLDLRTRGGFASSSKPAASLKPPPKGPAPGASTQAKGENSQK